MKTFHKAVALGAALTLGVAMAPTRTYAGDREWATVGKVLTGVAAVGVFAAIINDADHHSGYARVDHCAPPPPPPPPPQCWIPPHWECRQQRVCVPGYWNTVVTPAEYGWVRQGCRSVYVQIRPACAQQVWVPERVEWREAKVWVPGHYEAGNGGYVTYNGPRRYDRD